MRPPCCGPAPVPAAPTAPFRTILAAALLLLLPLRPLCCCPCTAGNPRDGWSQELSVRTPPAAGQYPLRLAVIGDLGLTPNSSVTLELLSGSEPEAIIHVGDLVYAGTPRQLCAASVQRAVGSAAAGCCHVGVAPSLAGAQAVPWP